MASRRKAKKAPKQKPNAQACAKCGRTGKKGAIDPDGLWRCWWHAEAKAGERAERAAKQKANRAKVEAARAAGQLPPEPEIEGRGQRPYADALRQVEAGRTPEPAGGEAPKGEEGTGDLLEGLSLSRSADRVTALHRVIDRMAVGKLTRTMGHGIIQAIKASAKEIEAGASDRGVVVRFKEIRTREEKDAFLAGEYGPTDASALMDD